MFKFNLKILLRNVRNKPVYSFISILGFTFGIAASLFIYFWVFDELSFEKFHPGHNEIYRVLTLSKQGDKIVKSASCAYPVAKTMKHDYPQIEDATFISYSSEDSPLKVEGESNKIEARRAWIDENFFHVFQGFKFVEGERETALNEPDKIVLSEKVAKKLFGNEPALGRTVFSDKYFEEVYVVGGVIKIPPQSHIEIGFLLSDKATGYDSGMRWRKSAFEHVYIKMQKNAEIDDQFRERASNHLSRYSSSTDKLMFQPIDDIHLYTDYETFRNDKKISHVKYVWIFSGLAILIIIMASLNFAMLTAARASERSTEVGVRKVNGSGKRDLVLQFISESVLQTLVATIIALVLVLLFLPWFGNITGKEFAFSLSGSLIISLILITVLVGLFSGMFPALYITSFNPVAIFKGGNPTGSKTSFTKSLVLVQFAIAIVLLVSTATIYKQLYFIKNRDLGIDKENIVVIPTGLWYSVGSFKQELLNNPNIISVSASTREPVDIGWQMGFAWDGMDASDTIQANLFLVDEDFAKTYNLQMVKGDFLRFNYSNYWDKMKESTQNKKDGNRQPVSIPVVVNETFVKQMGIDDPIGMRLNKNDVIIGVVKDFNYRPLQYPIGPLVLQNNPEAIQTLNVKIRPEKQAETLAFIRDIYKKHRDDRSFSYSFFEDELEQVYQSETRLGSLVFKFSFLAIVIALMGIFGLSTFATKRRVKEIGIRKVNGARLSEILLLLNSDFIKWVLLAFIIAAPTSWFIMNRWMQNFAYKTDLNWWIFALAGVFSLGIALLTVSIQSWKAATRNPVEALRYE